MESVFSIILAILALSVLVCIHELGHFLMARRVGMRVEAFAIGFGKPIFTWMRGGVKWMICLLPFGGYVRIAGMQKEGGKEPYEVSDGFYGKKPLQRIGVALAGPLVNIFFALLLFAILWISGGREKPFTEFTHRIGWVDPHSSLYEYGVRPGDVIDQYQGHPFHGYKDLLVASLMKEKEMQIAGEKINPDTGEMTPFDYTLPTYPNPLFPDAKFQTIGLLAPASYLIFSEMAFAPTLAPPSAPTYAGGATSLPTIQRGDRLVWANGEQLFSIQQLNAIVNRSTALLTIERDGTRLQKNVARIRLDDLRLTPYEWAEIGDWQYEIGLKGRQQDLFFIPYSLSPTGVVERRLDFLIPQNIQQLPPSPLQEGDRIVAIDGMHVDSSYQLLTALQTRRVLLIVERDSPPPSLTWKNADAELDHFPYPTLHRLTSRIGQMGPLQEGNLHLLQPITPQQKGNRLILGLGLTDCQVTYNPNPFEQFEAVVIDTWRTLTALFSGSLNPKYMSGPVGIVHMVQQSWLVGFKEVLFWLGLISLNLGIVNLLPIPVLDGGHILLSLFEAIRRKPLRAKTMERLIIPFVGVLILFFLYITYQDISRLFLKFF